MSDLSAARSSILGSIRSALGSSAAAEQIAAEYGALPRDYKRQGTLQRGALLSLLEHRLREYDAGVARTAPEGIAGEIKRLLTERGRTHIAVPAGLAASWLPEGFDFQTADTFDCYALDKLDGVLTGCTVAIAETGSIVLQNAPGQGPRSLSLVPDYHLCIVLAEQIVETVPESFARLENSASLATTFFSGPSATADIEMTRIKGVHGPRFLDVILVD